MLDEVDVLDEIEDDVVDDTVDEDDELDKLDEVDVICGVGVLDDKPAPSLLGLHPARHAAHSAAAIIFLMLLFI